MAERDFSVSIRKRADLPLAFHPPRQFSPRHPQHKGAAIVAEDIICEALGTMWSIESRRIFFLVLFLLAGILLIIGTMFLIGMVLGSLDRLECHLRVENGAACPSLAGKLMEPLSGASNATETVSDHVSHPEVRNMRCNGTANPMLWRSPVCVAGVVAIIAMTSSMVACLYAMFICCTNMSITIRTMRRWKVNRMTQPVQVKYDEPLG